MRWLTKYFCRRRKMSRHVAGTGIGTSKLAGELLSLLLGHGSQALRGLPAVRIRIDANGGMAGSILIHANPEVHGADAVVNDEKVDGNHDQEDSQRPNPAGDAPLPVLIGQATGLEEQSLQRSEYFAIHVDKLMQQVVPKMPQRRSMTFMGRLAAR